MASEERTLKSMLQAIFNNGFLSFGLGFIAGLTIDNLMVVLAIALVVGGLQWYFKSNKTEEAEAEF